MFAPQHMTLPPATSAQFIPRRTATNSAPERSAGPRLGVMSNGLKLGIATGVKAGVVRGEAGAVSVATGDS